MFDDLKLFKSKALLLTAVLLTGALAGCASSSESGDEEGLAFASFEEAMNEDGNMYEPSDPADSSLRLKVMKPNPDDTTPEKKEWLMLIWDSDTNSPVTDADVTMEARMPAMGHGVGSACTEENPTHEEYGVYIGATCASMEGEWNVNIDVFPANGDRVAFDVPMSVHDHAHADDGHDHEH